MSRKNKSVLPPELDALVRVTPEQTQKAMAKLKQKVVPPEESNAKRRSKKQLYCPYCAEYRIFKSRNVNGYRTYKRCTGCGISVEDFDVKKYNKLFQKSGK